jgi:Fe-S-cluster containining protein
MLEKMKISRKTSEDDILRLSKIECKECTHCCEYGSGIVLKHEVKDLAKNFKLSEKEFISKYLEKFTNFNTTHYKFKTVKKDQNKETSPPGRCVLLKNGCTIHNIKPLHCRIGSCNDFGEELNIWFTVNNFVNQYDPESIRQWATYIKLGNKKIEGTELKDLVPDDKKLKEILEYKILR